MTIITLEKPLEKPINIVQLTKEMLDISVTGQEVLLNVSDDLNLSEEQITVLQTIVNNHTLIPKDSIVIKLFEIYDNMTINQMIAVSTHEGIRSIFNTLNFGGGTEIMLTSNFATKLMDYMLTENLIDQDTRDAIQLMLEGKGLSF